MFVYILMLLRGGLPNRGRTEGISDVWLSPECDETFVNGSKHDITWTFDFASRFRTYCPSCDTDKVDLCVQPYSTRNWNTNLASKRAPAADRNRHLTTVKKEPTLTKDSDTRGPSISSPGR